MKPLSAMVRLSRWQLEEAQRQLNGLMEMRADLADRAAKLDSDLLVEQDVAKSPEVSFVFPGFAGASMLRKKALMRSIEDLRPAIDEAGDAVEDAFREFKKYELMEERRVTAEQQETARRERIDLDEIAINIHRRKDAG